MVDIGLGEGMVVGIEGLCGHFCVLFRPAKNTAGPCNACDKEGSLRLGGILQGYALGPSPWRSRRCARGPWALGVMPRGVHQMIAALEAGGQISEGPCGHQRVPRVGDGSPHKAHEDVGAERTVLHPIVKHHHPQFRACVSHALQAVQPVLTDGHGHGRQA